MVGLYGGALECVIPVKYEDVSNFRQIPNHQEVFADASADSSIIIEINEMAAEVPDEKVLQHYFQDLATCNEAKSAMIVDPMFLPPESMPHLEYVAA